MTRTEKIEQIITKMEKLNDLWWDAEENKNQEALEEHNILEQEIRAEMAEIGIDFDTVGAEYEDMIQKLKGYTEEEEKEMSEIKIQFTYYHDPVTLDHLKEMIPVTQTDYDDTNDVGRLPYQTVLRSTADGRYYCRNKGETDQEYRCIIAEEYYKGEPYEGVVIGFILV